MEEKDAIKLIHKTIGDYNIIAHEFSSKREFLSDDIKNLKYYVIENDKVLDFGCGNGRLSELFKGMKISYFGVDVSEKLIEIAKTRYQKEKFLLMNDMPLPFQDEYFNKIFSLAVFHHIPTDKIRKLYLNELKRVLKPGGLLVLSVWQIPEDKAKHYKKPSGGEAGDMLVPFKIESGKSLVERYVHQFTEDEIVKLVKSCGFEILNVGISERGKRGYENLQVVAKK